MKEVIRLTRCLNIIESYSKQEPLAIHIKRFFSRHKDMGSTDRRICRELVYHYFRLGNGLIHEKPEFRLSVAAYIFQDKPDEMLQFLSSRYSNLHPNAAITDPVLRFENACRQFNSLHKSNLFPLVDHVSAEIDREAWLHSFFVRPLIWVRIKRKAETEVLREFSSIGLSPLPSLFNNQAYGLEPESHITNTLSYRKGLFEIQDLSSQLTLDYMQKDQETETWWDCCAGSGGKSLLLLDAYPSLTLTVSDIRQSILENLEERFHKSGHTKVEYHIMDLTKPMIRDMQVDRIILDAPCTGSGTWNRTPEMLNTFSEERILTYSEKQKQILQNIVSTLSSGGKITYITCSVFKEENEDVVAFAEKELPLVCLKKEIIPGYKYRADTLFAALLEKK